MIAVVAGAAEAAVDATNFLTASQASKEAYKTANLLKSLSVNALIGGEHGTGKLSLARYILPDAAIYSANDFEEILAVSPSSKKLIITNIENTPNLNTLFSVIEEHRIRLIATTSSEGLIQQSDEHFSIKVLLPPLRERLEDIEMLQQVFIKEAEDIFGKANVFDFHEFEPDVSQNAYSLRRQIMLHYLLGDVAETELMQIIEAYLSDKLGSNNDYRDFLHLYEVPLIRAGMKRFKSQLQLSERLGLNRNTLRKKIAENEPFGLIT